MIVFCLASGNCGKVLYGFIIRLEPNCSKCQVLLSRLWAAEFIVQRQSVATSKLCPFCFYSRALECVHAFLLRTTTTVSGG